MTRTGPKPLPVHLALATAACTQKHGDPQHASAALSGLLRGIRKYQLSEYERNLPALPQIWRAGEARLWLAEGGEKTPLLLIPSMVNSSSILDLMPERSLMRWLAQQGRDVALLDWGASPQDPGQAEVEALVLQRLVPALEFLSARYNEPVHALGYCMGGVFLAGAAQAAPACLKSCVFLATPWDFHAGDAVMADKVAFNAPAGLGLVQSQGFLPSRWIQAVFASLDPEMAVQKFSGFADMDESDERARIFVAVEDWLNEGLDLPGAVASTCITRWYRHNDVAQGRWEVGGQPVKAKNIVCPALVVTAARDRIVPPDSSRALLQVLPEGEALEADTGHIGLIAGRDAITSIWHPLDAWISKNDR